MASLQLQDAFQPYYDGRRSGFATVEPKAIEKAVRLMERIEEIRRKEQERQHDQAA